MALGIFFLVLSIARSCVSWPTKRGGGDGQEESRGKDVDGVEYFSGRDATRRGVMRCNVVEWDDNYRVEIGHELLKMARAYGADLRRGQIALGYRIAP